MDQRFPCGRQAGAPARRRLPEVVPGPRLLQPRCLSHAETDDVREHGHDECCGGAREEKPLPEAQLIPCSEVGAFFEVVPDPREHDENPDRNAYARDETRGVRLVHGSGTSIASVVYRSAVTARITGFVSEDTQLLPDLPDQRRSRSLLDLPHLTA